MTTHTFLTEDELQELLHRTNESENRKTSLEDVSEITGQSVEHLEAELKVMKLQKEIESLKSEIRELKTPIKKKGFPTGVKILLWGGAAFVTCSILAIILLILAII